MRALLMIAVSLSSPLGALAQTSEPALESNGYVALSADDEAQSSLGGFRRYLERIHTNDAELYLALDPPLRELESRETWSDVVFWTATILAIGAMVAAIPIAVDSSISQDHTLIAGTLIGGGGAIFVIGLLINAFLRPGHDDLQALVDRHDALVGRR